MTRPFTVQEQSAHFLDRPHTGMPVDDVTGPAAWRVHDLPPLSTLALGLSTAEISVLRRGVDAVRATGRHLDTPSASDFGFHDLAPAFDSWRTELLKGRGFVFVRGVPVLDWPREDLALLMRGIALQFGRPGAQNARGDVIGEVRNTGAADRDAYVRNYVTNREFRFHCDAADLLGLLCVRKAARGGKSRLASSVTVFNELRRRRPGLAQRLFEPVLLDLRNEQPEGAPAYGALTPCAHADGVLRTIYISDYFRSVERHADVELPASDLELLDLYEEIAADPANCLSFNLEPGDILLVNNHFMLHARTAFEDAPGAERLLLRFLVSVGA